jgi:hypothetical protein
MVATLEQTNLLNMAIVGTCLVLTSCASDVSPQTNEPSPTTAPTVTTPTAVNAAPSAPSSSSQGSAPIVANSAAAGAPGSAIPTTTPQAPASAPISGGALPKLDAKTPFKDVPAECHGIEVVGLKHSPGGTTLPNKCAPFDGLHNNPYAIRCLDADPTYTSGYAGDDFCILPPPAELGVQIHVGPEDYKNPGTFALPPGSEENTMYYVNAPNPADHYYYRTNWRMRHGSHHMIITVSDSDRADGWAADLTSSGSGGFDLAGGAGGSRNFGGAQRPDQDRPQGTLEVPPENLGLGSLLKAKQQFSFNLHHINTSDKAVLREAWVNAWYMDEKDVTQKMQSLSASGSPLDVSIPARQRTVLTYKCDVQSDSRIITMNGHRHAHTDRFGVWVKKASGETISAYESFDWEDMPTYQYDSVSTNPKPDMAQKRDGASSGELKLGQGDQLYFLCDINNTLDVPLKFANEAIDGEMCILFGSYVGSASPCSAGATRVRDQ